MSRRAKLAELAREVAQTLCPHVPGSCEARGGKERCRYYRAFLDYPTRLYQLGAALPIPEEHTVFHAWTDGDRSVGIDGDAATLLLHAPDKEAEDYAKEQLRELLRPVWDFKIQVATEEELAAYTHDDGG